MFYREGQRLYLSTSTNIVGERKRTITINEAEPENYTPVTFNA
jgi:hypothetical protein